MGVSHLPPGQSHFTCRSQFAHLTQKKLTRKKKKRRGNWRNWMDNFLTSFQKLQGSVRVTRPPTRVSPPPRPFRAHGSHTRFCLEVGSTAWTSFARPRPAAQGHPWGPGHTGEAPRSGCTLHPSTPAPARRRCRRRTHLIEDNPGRLPGELLSRPRHALPCPPEEVSVGDVKERHAQVAPHARQALQHALGDRRRALKGS